MTKKMITI